MARADIRFVVDATPALRALQDVAAQGLARSLLYDALGTVSAAAAADAALLDGIVQAAGGRGVVATAESDPTTADRRVTVTLRRREGVVTRAEVRAAQEYIDRAGPVGVDVVVRASNPPQSMQPWRDAVLDDVDAFRVAQPVRLGRLRARVDLRRLGLRPTRDDTPLPLP